MEVCLNKTETAPDETNGESFVLFELAIYCWLILLRVGLSVNHTVQLCRITMQPCRKLSYTLEKQ